MFSPKLHVRAVGYDQNVVICSRSLGKHSKAAFPSRLVSRNKQLQVTEEAPLRSVISNPLTIPLQGPRGRESQINDAVYVHAKK